MLSLNILLYWDTNKCFESIWGLSAAIGWWTHLWIIALGHCSCAFFTAFLCLSCSSWMNSDTAEMEQCDQGTLIWKHSCPTGLMWCGVVEGKETLKCLLCAKMPPVFQPWKKNLQAFPDSLMTELSHYRRLPQAHLQQYFQHLCQQKNSSFTVWTIC